MLTLIALSAALLQEPPAPPAPPEVHTRVMVMGPHGSLDRDGDGQVTREEFAAPMSDHFARLDKDGDGRLSADELSGAHGADGDMTFFRGGPAGEGGVHRFELRGPGGRGEAREIVVHGPAGHGMPRMMHGPGHGATDGETRIEVRHMGGEGHGDMDKDGDGRISEAEFTGPLREAFARMDADRSGFIEQGERGGDGEVRVFTHRIETRDED